MAKWQNDEDDERHESPPSTVEDMNASGEPGLPTFRLLEGIKMLLGRPRSEWERF